MNKNNKSFNLLKKKLKKYKLRKECLKKEN